MARAREREECPLCGCSLRRMGKNGAHLECGNCGYTRKGYGRGIGAIAVRAGAWR